MMFRAHDFLILSSVYVALTSETASAVNFDFSDTSASTTKTIAIPASHGSAVSVSVLGTSATTASFTIAFKNDFTSVSPTINAMLPFSASANALVSNPPSFPQINSTTYSFHYAISSANPLNAFMIDSNGYLWTTVAALPLAGQLVPLNVTVTDPTLTCFTAVVSYLISVTAIPTTTTTSTRTSTSTSTSTSTCLYF